MGVSETEYDATTKQFVTLEGTLAEIITQLQTDGIHLKRCVFSYDAGNSKFVCIYQ